MNCFNTWIVKKKIAHRGLYNEKMPENTFSAFENAIKNGFAIELDVQEISDGTVVVFHDSTLHRVTNKDGYVKNLKKEELSSCKICKTNETIPTFEETLKLIDGRTPILIEIKNSTSKVGSLEKKVWEILEKYNGEYAVMSFNPYSLEWFKKHAPKVMRGQLSSNFKGEKLALLKKFTLSRMIFNKLVSEPHFIAYKYEALPNRFVRRYKNLPLLAWTIRNEKDENIALSLCDNIIFENYIPKEKK